MVRGSIRAREGDAVTVTAPARPAPRLPFWLRRPPRKPVEQKARPTPREPRWWIGVGWIVLAALSLGFVAHVTLVGSLQHSRAQFGLYQSLRTELAQATSPLGQLDVDGELVPFGTPIGTIEIESIGVSEVFLQGTRPEDLISGPGHRRDTVMPGQAGTSVIMGRQATYGGPFSGLAGLAIGDEIEIITGQGTSTYEVFTIRREGDLLPEPLDEGEGRLELVTADGIPLAPSGSLHVDAELVSEVFETPAPVFTKAVLDPSEFAMGAVASDWLPALFWLQWLVIASVALRWVRQKWGGWQTWVVAVPVLLALGAATSGAVMSLMPNLL